MMIQSQSHQQWKESQCFQSVTQTQIVTAAETEWRDYSWLPRITYCNTVQGVPSYPNYQEVCS